MKCYPPAFAFDCQSYNDWGGKAFRRKDPKDERDAKDLKNRKSGVSLPVLQALCVPFVLWVLSLLCPAGGGRSYRGYGRERAQAAHGPGFHRFDVCGGFERKRSDFSQLCNFGAKIV